jgi:hypothetical protein
MTKRTCSVLAICLLLGCAATIPAMAADKPNFSGSWKLNAEKSDFGPMPKPERIDYVLTHKDPELVVKSTAMTQAGEISNEVKILTDGTEFTNDLHGQQIKGTAKWEGATLVVTQKASMQGTEIVVVTRWSLADDGKSITQEVSISTPQGELKQKAVLDKV